MSTDQQDENDRWLTERLGKASPALRRIVRSAVIGGGWWIDSVNDWNITLCCIDGDSELELTIWRANGRFTGARLRRKVVLGSSRLVSAAEHWVDSAATPA